MLRRRIGMAGHLLLGDALLLPELCSAILEPYLEREMERIKVWMGVAIQCLIIRNSSTSATNARDSQLAFQLGEPSLWRRRPKDFSFKILFLFIHCSKNKWKVEFYVGPVFLCFDWGRAWEEEGREFLESKQKETHFQSIGWLLYWLETRVFCVPRSDDCLGKNLAAERIELILFCFSSVFF